MTPNEISFPLAPKAPQPPESGLAEIIDGPIDEGDYPKDGWSEPTIVSDPIAPVPEVVSDVIQKQPVGSDSYKKARRFHADTPFVLGVLLFLVAAMAGASFYVSFSGLFAAAAWAVGDNPPLQFAVPIMLDVAIIAFTLSLFVERERGERVWGTWMAISIFAGVSAIANIFHTLQVSTAVNVQELVIGGVISGGAPILLAFASDKIAKRVFKPADPVTK
jgi:hypothetical protein